MTSFRASIFIIIMLLFGASCSKKPKKESSIEKPTILILGGTPSTKDILNDISDSLKHSYNIISFNRPGFGGTPISEMSKEKLYQLAKEAGLKENDYGVIGISGGAPLSILLADAFKLKHCGIISGMVSNKAYFKFADSTFTKDFFMPVTESFEQFEKTILSFPNLDAIVLQAGTKNKEEAIKASYNELHFILSENLYANIKNKSIPIDWWHGENDKNVAKESVELFLEDFPNSKLNTLQEADHGIDARIFIGKIINDWKNQKIAD